MGKTPSPHKWIKNLLGKKPSKSSSTRGSHKLKSAKKEEMVASVKDDVSNLPIDPPVVSGTVVTEEKPSEEFDISSVKEDNVGNELNINPDSETGSGELTREQAAKTVQTAFRAHQARREFRTLKGTIGLQAVIRGRLVRRQAIATYSCIWGIVKLQALVRGQKARSSDDGLQLRERFTEARKSETLQESACSWMENASKLSIIDKLLVSSPTALPLKLQYDHENPNSAKVWLARWTRLKIWSPGSRSSKSLISKPVTKKRNFQTIETEKGRPKQGIKKKPSGQNTENNSGHSTAENEKPKRNVRKASTLVGKELPRIENGKAKESSRKNTISSMEGSPLEVKDEKPKPSLKKPERDTHKSAEKKKDNADPEQKDLDVEASASSDDVPVEKKGDVPNAVSKDSNFDKDEKSEGLGKSEQDELNAVVSNDKAEDGNDTVVELRSENGNLGSENTKASDRRASLPAKIDDQDDGLTQSARKLPSYMAPTESAKARVKGQGSSRFAQERRHSLSSSSANGKLSSMTPRAHRLLLASGKGSMNSDRAFSGDKSIKAEWKR
ncbi:PREDICTED: protein IQ-DOMAIN 31-like [Tarenaya hassleriana]|uniref:protein IQ-DOMAIN 31-like n=1 Tax=Tarenaya hassleriana TaxID=28532 RepID=UPI00053C27F1|nr:PREDICTED: protein IQ-DOMAIN 31-like [Tarenaya hassleriana]XP_010554326.1 PREDICTED: protein IQ-DOMAIN 31-like [Tarenaya hassleriana]XP_010554327.1 PREDICTED: protein IQ-DOMAIN 31-like [Tarenaya hassleriana]